MRDYFKEFIKSEQSSGIVLIICTVISLILANSVISDSYLGFFKSYIGPESLGLKLTVVYWINDLLMAVFFLLVGLEIKREFVNGELSSFKRAILPLFVAIGGMAVPAIIYTLKNAGTPTASGWGIPMATDIAFALGIIALAGKSVPKSLKVFLVALAVVDDLGAILVIAIFYTANLGVSSFMYAGICLLILFIINRLKVKKIFIYFIPGIFLWYFVFQSGIHATIAGVLLALTIPISKRYNDSPLHKLEHALHKPVNFLVMPIFALANTAIVLDASFISALTSNYSLGIILGLFIGKPLGVFLFTYALIKMKVTSLPQGSTWGQVIGTGFIAGIGFTMSIFICTLAFNDPEIIERAKLSILVASLLSGIVGFILLKSASKSKAYV